MSDEMFNENEFEFDDQELRNEDHKYECFITCDETKHKEDRKMILNEIKEFDVIVKSLSELLNNVKTIKEKFEKRLQSITVTKETKRSPTLRKEKVEFIISKSDLQEKYQSLFISNLTAMKMSSFEDVIKAYFDNNVLKQSPNFVDIAITPEEYELHCEAVKNNDELNCITTKDISTLVKRMYRTIEVTKYTKDGVTVQLQYNDLVSKTPHNVIANLQDLNLIKIDYQGISTTSSYSRSEALAYLLDQIPKLKHLNLVQTDMKGYNTVDSLIKLIMILQDPLLIYYKLNTTSESAAYVKQLSLPLVELEDEKFFKLETLQKAYKNINKSTKVALPNKDTVFYKLLSH